MTIIGDAFIAVKPDAAKFGPEIEKSVVGSMGNIAKKAAIAFGGVFAAQKVGSFLTEGIGAVREIERLNRQTEAVIKSTGGAANVSLGEIEKLAGGIEKLSGQEAEAIQGGANMLLTFKNIRNEAGKGNDIFNQSTMALADMAAAMGTDPQQAAIGLGKALNDPIKGITALSRVGIQFTKEQQDQIKWLTENGRTMDAQKLILGELESQFGGSAAAQNDASKQLGHTIGELQERMPAGLIPIIDFVASKLTTFLPAAFDVVSGAFSRVADLFGRVAGVIRSAWEAVMEGFEFGVTDQGGILGFFATIGNLAYTTVLPALREVADKVGAFFKTLTTGFTEDEGTPIENFALRVRDAFAFVFDAYQQYLGFVFGTAIPAAADFLTGTVIPGVVDAIGSLIDGFQGKGGEGSFFTDLGEAIRNVVDFVVNDAIPAFEEHLLPIIERLIDFVKANAKPILITLGVALAALAAPVLTAVAAFVFMYQRFEIVRTVVATVVGALQGLIGFLTTTVAPFVAKVAGAIAGQFATLGAAISERMGAITEAIGHIVEVLKVVLAVVLGVFICPLIIAWQQFGDEIIAIIKIAWDQVQNIVSTAVALLTAVIDTALALINGDFGAAWNAIKEIPRIAFDYIITTVGNLLAVVKQILGGAWETIKAVASAAWTTLRDQTLETFGGLVSSIGGKIDTVVGFVTGIPGRIRSAARGAFDGLLDAVKQVVRNIAIAWNKIDLTFKVPDIPGVPRRGERFDIIPDVPVPSLARGGLIRARPGTGILARIGEATRPTNEAVVPLPDAVVAGLARIAEGGFGETVQLVMPAGIGESNAVAVAIASVQELRSDKWRRRGK